MNVELVASDSMGARSMAVSVTTPDVSVFIDPGVALGPKRFSLPPAIEEEEALVTYGKKIDRLASKADMLVLSHYHYDHHIVSAEGFKDKKVFLKDTGSNINKSQKERGEYLLSMIEDIAQIVPADGKSVEEGSTTISFSPPVPHGPQGTRLGYVLMTSISQGDKTVVHTSDVEGLLTDEEVDWVLDQNPTLVVADGPPAYLLGFKFSKKSMEVSIQNFRRLLENSDCELVIDHHLLRSKNYKEKMDGLFDDPRVTTFSGHLGLKDNLLEANRRELHAKKGGE